MSLYNNFELKTKKLDVSTLLRGGSKSLFGSTLNKALNTSIGQQLTSFAGQYGVQTDLLTSLANKYAGQWIDKQVDRADQLLSSQIKGWLATNNFSYDGLPQRLEYQEFIALSRVRKNHFIVQMESKLAGNFSEKLNLFVTDADLNPMNISGEKHRVGGAFVDSPTGAEATEVRLTTMDDKQGTIKRWFEQHCAAVAASDGTFGVPANYAITIRVLHGVVDGEDVTSAFVNKGLYRAANYEVQLSRREQAMQEVTLTFSQLDSFMR